MIFLPDLIARRYRRGWFLTIYLLCCVFLASMIFLLNDFLSPYRSTLVARDEIARYVPAGQPLYQYRVDYYGIDFYNKIRTPIVEDFGELADGIAKMPVDERKKYFLSVDDFDEKIKQESEVYCITKRPKKLKELQAKPWKVDILWENGEFFLLRIRN